MFLPKGDVETLATIFEEITSIDPPSFLSRIHGPLHWLQVEAVGYYIASQNGASIKVITYFALFHDLLRYKDYQDPGHGSRGACLARILWNSYRFLTEDEFAKLKYACEMHTDQKTIDEVTIATCWDADRIDLRRINKTPSIDYMSTSEAKQLISSSDNSELALVNYGTPLNSFLNTHIKSYR